MNPEDKKLLQEVHDLSKENNKILHGIRRSNRWSSIFRAIYWIIIIGVSIGAFVFLQPYITSALKAYKDIQSGINSVKSATSKIPGY